MGLSKNCFFLKKLVKYASYYHYINSNYGTLVQYLFTCLYD